MNDGQNVTTTEQTSGSQSMADIAATVQSNTDASASQSTSQNDGGQATQTSDNVNDFQSFVQQTSAATQTLKSEIESLKTEHNEFVNAQHREAVNKEIDSAAEQINKEAGADSDMARLWIETQYSKDPNLQKVWDNRAENPEALAKALDVLKGEWEAKNKVQIDPQVAADQRALKESQRPGSTMQEDDLDTKLSNMDDGEFMRTMRRLSS